MIIAAALLAAAAGTVAAQQPATAPSYKYGLVNTERVMRESRESQRAVQALEAEFKKREQEIAGGPKGDVDRRMRALLDDMNLRREEVQKQFADKANAVIKRIGQQENYDAVFYEAVFAAARVDLTDRVIKELDAGR